MAYPTVKLAARARNKYSTALRAAISGRNAAADAKDMELYRVFDEALQLAHVGWEEAQAVELSWPSDE